MAESEDKHASTPDEEDETAAGYKAPAKASVDELLQKDQEDESLRKYKESLLGPAAKGVEAPFPNNPENVIVKSLSLVVEGRDDKTLDLTGDLSKLKETVFTIKEGASYRIKIEFYVQREIVSGLKYIQKVSRAVGSNKEKYMLGSYGPKAEPHTFLTPAEEAPSGMIFRGAYTVDSTFTDDDGNKILVWKWKFEIKKEWD